MRIIDRVEINYFRSIYSISLNDNTDVNVITGSNDAGKSNLLKALNLFFNNETEPHRAFEFVRDLNRFREGEARSANRRMTVWIKIHFNNFLNWKSLPPHFFVKRTWNRYLERPVDSFENDIPATTIGRFLAKLRYHYIPAIRSKEIFSDLLADLHDTLIQDEAAGLRKSSDALVADLHDLTADMSKSIKDAIKVDSTINLPESLQDLFRSLDFTTVFGNHEILLALRGDGIQSRHLPFILNYIAQRSGQFHIWGYEEPENSLELSKSFEMANDFKDDFGKSNQIYLTTHSPAFYDLSGPTVSRWFAESIQKDEAITTQLTSTTSASSIDETMGLLNIIAPRMKKVYDESLSLRESLAQMQASLDKASSGLVYVEGPSDKQILEHAQKVLGFDDLSLNFESAGGSSNITQFLKVSSRVKADDKTLIGLYDGDATGRKELEHFKSAHFFPVHSLGWLIKLSVF